MIASLPPITQWQVHDVIKRAGKPYEIIDRCQVTGLQVGSCRDTIRGAFIVEITTGDGSRHEERWPMTIRIQARRLGSDKWRLTAIPICQTDQGPKPPPWIPCAAVGGKQVSKQS